MSRRKREEMLKRGHLKLQSDGSLKNPGFGGDRGHLKRPESELGSDDAVEPRTMRRSLRPGSVAGTGNDDRENGCAGYESSVAASTPNAVVSSTVSATTESFSASTPSLIFPAGFSIPVTTTTPASTPPYVSVSPGFPLSLDTTSTSANTNGISSWNYFLPCLDAFWNGFNKIVPLVHRKTFESAYTPGSSTIYGTKAPLALAFAMAATGARGLTGQGLTEHQKVQLTRDYCDKCKNILFSGYYGRTNTVSPPSSSINDRPISDLEAAQATMLLMQVLMPLGKAADAFAVHRAGVMLVQALASASHPSGRGTWITTDVEPQNAHEWVFSELMVRVWTGFAALESSYAYHSNRRPLIDFFNRRTRLPCHDSFFFHDDPEEAFRLLYASPLLPAQATPTVDFASYLTFENLNAGVQLVQQLILPVFSYRAGMMAMIHLDNFFRDLRHRLRDFAKGMFIQPLAAMNKRKDEYTPAEALYDIRVTHFGKLVEQTYLSLPDGIGEALLHGDPGPFFEKALLLFSEPAQAHMALNMMMTIKSTDLEHYMEGDPASAGPTLFTSPDFLPVLECGVIITRLLERQQLVDPQLEWTHFLLLAPTFKIGAIALSAVALLGEEGKSEIERCGYGRDLRVLLKVIEANGRNFGLFCECCQARPIASI